MTGDFHGIDKSKTLRAQNIPNVTPATVPTNTETTQVKTTPEGTITTKTTPLIPGIDYNTSVGREAEVNKHLSDAYNSGMTTPDSIKAFASYNTADANKKALIDAFIKSKSPQSSNDYLNLLVNGQNIDISQRNNPFYTSALQDYSKIKSFQNSTGKEISSAVDSGALIEGTAAFDALAKVNPNAIAEYQRIKANKNIATNVNNQANGMFNSMNSVSNYDRKKSVASQSSETSPVEDFLQKLSDKLTQNVAPDYAKMWSDAITANPDVNTYKTSIVDLQSKLKQNQQAQINLEDDIKARYANTGADQSYIDAKIREGLKPIYREQNNLNIQLQTAQDHLTMLTQNAKDQIDFAQKSFQDQQSQTNQALQLAQMGIAQQNFKSGQQFQATEAEKARAGQKELVAYQQSYANPDINSTDPNISRIAAQKLVSDALTFAQTNGIPVQRDAGKIISDAQQYAQENGVSLAQALQTTFTDPLHAKPEFTQALENIQSAKSTGGKLQVVGQRVDPATGSVVNVYGTVDKYGNVSSQNSVT